MLIKKRIGTEIPSSEITPRHIYMSRRTFMAGGAAVAGAGLLAACAPRTDLSGAGSAGSLASASETAAPPVVIPGQTDELGDRLTDFNDVTGYNNYYEFSTNKEAVAGKAQGFSTNPWAVEIAGKVRNPGTFDIDTLLHEFDQEERIYRLRCVEGWSMVIPWLGFPLAALLKQAEPTACARMCAAPWLAARGSPR